MKELIELNVNLDMTKIRIEYNICRIKYKYCDCFLEYTNFKDDLIEYKCLNNESLIEYKCFNGL